MSASTAADAAGVPLLSNTSTPSRPRIAIELPSSPTSPYERVMKRKMPGAISIFVGEDRPCPERACGRAETNEATASATANEGRMQNYSPVDDFCVRAVEGGTCPLRRM